MGLEPIKTSRAPKAIGPYSQAMIDRETNIVYVSGQIAIDSKDNVFHENQTIEEQTERILNNLKNILEKSGSNFEKVIKTRIYLTNISEFDKVNKIYAKHFFNHKPARVTVGVVALPLGAKIEIECEAKI